MNLSKEKAHLSSKPRVENNVISVIYDSSTGMLYVKNLHWLSCVWLTYLAVGIRVIFLDLCACPVDTSLTVLCLASFYWGCQ